MSIESKYDVPFVAALALREKQIQQNYRPIIAVHKWFARRPGTLFRSLMISEFGDAPLPSLYFKANDFAGRKIADPFMGGGTPLIEANRLGCDVAGVDINPMATWIVREEIDSIDLYLYQSQASSLLDQLRSEVEVFYRTDCPIYGDSDVSVKYFLWVKVLDCSDCGQPMDLFPSYLLAEDRRHTANVVVCSFCNYLNEVTSLNDLGACQSCETPLRLQGPARRNKCVCPHCGQQNRYPRPGNGSPRHRLFAIEYYNPQRIDVHKGRFFKKPDVKDFMRFANAEKKWMSTGAKFAPEQSIPSGDETDRLHRWGYSHYRQMFNSRQLLSLELSCRFIDEIPNQRIRQALATNLSDLLRYQNMLCRYDTWALKSLDIFSIHGFPVGLIQCESNVLGNTNPRGINVGSGGWSNIIEKYTRAKRYCDEPFEVKRDGSRTVRVPIKGESIGTKHRDGRISEVSIHCADSATVSLPPESLDAVFTDPPYFGNVQYGELMDFCYVWLRRLVGSDVEGFANLSARSNQELTGNTTKSRGLVQFTDGLATTYKNMAQALKPGAPLAFTYHHNSVEAYFAVGVAILDAGLTCSASLPCPAEMGGSIHIHGTSSSIIDTIFVCRDQGLMRKGWLFDNSSELAEIISTDLAQIALAGRKATRGDARCITLGHLTRMAIWNLRKDWNPISSTPEKLNCFAEAVNALPNLDNVLAMLPTEFDGIMYNGSSVNKLRLFERKPDAVSF